MTEQLKPMTAHRAIYFMERFRKEEKLLGPNEQAAVAYVIAMLEDQDAQPAQPAQAVPADTRTCTCHPNDNPPVPCAQKYSLNECRAAQAVPITSESGNQAAQGASGITSGSVPLLSDEEIDALYAKSDLEADPGSDYGCGFYSGARWAEQAVRAKMGVAVPMTDDISELLRQVRELIEVSRRQPGVAFPVPKLVRIEGRKFLQGNPSLFDRLPFGEVQSIAGLIDAPHGIVGKESA